MNKKQLVGKISTSMNLSKADAERQFDGITEIILKIFVKVRYANIINIIANKMIVPELTNSSLTKKKFIKYFVNLITDFDSNEKQIIAIDSYLNQIETNQPPFTIAAKKIDEYLQ